MKGVEFDRAPEDPRLLRARIRGEDLHWRWRLSRNAVAVDWLFEMLRSAEAPSARGVKRIDYENRTHAFITAFVREHWVPGDETYEEPRQVEEREEDRRFDYLERGGSGSIAQMLAKSRWRHEREVRWLRQEIKMLRRQLQKERHDQVQVGH